MQNKHSFLRRADAPLVGGNIEIGGRGGWRGRGPPGGRATRGHTLEPDMAMAYRGLGNLRRVLRRRSDLHAKFEWIWEHRQEVIAPHPWGAVARVAEVQVVKPRRRPHRLRMEVPRARPPRLASTTMDACDNE